MINEILKSIVSILVCTSLVYAPLLRAGQLSLPTDDLIAPVVTQKEYKDTVNIGSEHQIKVMVSDNVSVQQVTLYFRVIGTSDYKRRIMQRVNSTDNYTATVTAQEIVSPGIEYYIKATDLAGNTLLHGYSFSPLSVKVAGSGAGVVAMDKVNISGASEEESVFSNKWVWIGLGVVVLGAAAGGGGSGGGETSTGTVIFSGSTP